jgi:hypothetical protein
MSDAGDKKVSADATDTNQANPEDQSQGEDQQTDSGTDAAKAARLEQQVGKLAKVLQATGLDPDSDLIDKFNSGVVSADELLKQVAGNLPRQEQPTTPKVPQTAAQRLAEIMQHVDQEGATEDDFKNAVGVMADYIQQQDQHRTMTNQELLAQSCQKTVVDFLMDDATHKSLSDEVKPIEQQLFFDSTDAIVGREARKTEHPETFLDPRQYQHYAKQNASNLAKLRGEYERIGYEKGLAAARGQKPQVRPISPSTGGGSPIQPQTKRINVKNMSAEAHKYLQNFGQQV